MQFKNYDWDDTNIEHLAQHAVTSREAEEACFNEPLIMKRSQERYLVYGRSDSGRYLFIVAAYYGQGLIRVITARDMTQTERKLYYRKRG